MDARTLTLPRGGEEAHQEHGWVLDFTVAPIFGLGFVFSGTASEFGWDDVRFRIEAYFGPFVLDFKLFDRSKFRP